MATFIHNEPTSLSVLQDLQLPQVLFSRLEQEIPPSFDVRVKYPHNADLQVISTIPNIIGAICLNQAGLELTTSHPDLLIRLVDITVSPLHEEAISERDNAQQLGASLDELVRHHPPLRPIVLGAIQELLRKTIDQGAAFEPPPDRSHGYVVDDISDNAASRPTEAGVTATITNPLITSFTKIFKVSQNSAMA